MREAIEVVGHVLSGLLRPSTRWFNPKNDRLVYYVPYWMGLVGIISLALVMIPQFPGRVGNELVKKHLAVSVFVPSSSSLHARLKSGV